MPLAGADAVSLADAVGRRRRTLLEECLGLGPPDLVYGTC